MNIIELDLADFSLVEVKTTNNCNPTPHCKLHGAMNKITVHGDGGGIWRCLSVHSITTIKIKNSISKKENDCVCRAGCLQVGPFQPPYPIDKQEQGADSKLREFVVFMSDNLYWPKNEISLKVIDNKISELYESIRSNASPKSGCFFVCVI